MYKKSLVCWLIGLSLVTMLAACSGGNATDNGTRTKGPIIIATDHATYPPTAPIKFSVINQTRSPIYVFDTQSACTILELEIQVNNQWEPSNKAACQAGRIPVRIKIAPGQTYGGTLKANAPKSKTAALPSGTYRLALFYTTATTSFSPLIRLTSETLSVTN